MKAQMARGADFENGNLIQKAKAMIPILVPLFVSALQRAEDLANAMEARGYSPGKPRTRYKVLKMKSYDYILIVCSFILMVSMIVLSRFYA